MYHGTVLLDRGEPPGTSAMASASQEHRAGALILCGFYILIAFFGRNLVWMGSLVGFLTAYRCDDVRPYIISSTGQVRNRRLRLHLLLIDARTMAHGPHGRPWGLPPGPSLAASRRQLPINTTPPVFSHVHPFALRQTVVRSRLAGRPHPAGRFRSFIIQLSHSFGSNASRSLI